MPDDDVPMVMISRKTRVPQPSIRHMAQRLIEAILEEEHGK